MNKSIHANENSSLKVEPWEVGEMTVIRHFTGTLLLSQREARQLRALLNHHLADVPEMPLAQAQALVAAYDAIVAEYTNG